MHFVFLVPFHGLKQWIEENVIALSTCQQDYVKCNWPHLIKLDEVRHQERNDPLNTAVDRYHFLQNCKIGAFALTHLLSKFSVRLRFEFWIRSWVSEWMLSIWNPHSTIKLCLCVYGSVLIKRGSSMILISIVKTEAIWSLHSFDLWGHKGSCVIALCL